MYRGFSLELPLEKNEAFEKLKLKGENLFDQYASVVRGKLNSFVSYGGALDGTAIQKTWFPQIECDVFISHSHQNIDTALVLAGWLEEKFKLKSFIDSCIWGYNDDLLWEIDSKFCTNGSPHDFNYHLRNQSTSHVHMMLSTALSMMIYSTECLFFLNTPQSIKSFGSRDKTLSPWIYSEIATTQIVEKKNPDRWVTEDLEYFNADGTRELKKAFSDITYDISEQLKDLTKIDFDDLINWQKDKRGRMHPLDILYNRHEPPLKNNLLHG